MAQNPASNFGRLEQLLGFHLRRAQVRVFHDFYRALAGYHLTPGLYGVLILVESNPGINQTALSVALGIDRSTVVGLIDRLEAEDWIARQPSGTDRRSYALVLTEKGNARLDQVNALVDSHEAAISNALTPQERALLLQLLPKIGSCIPEEAKAKEAAP